MLGREVEILKTVLHVFWNPPEAYKGGISKILDDYIEKSELFRSRGYDIKLFNHQIRDSYIYYIPYIGSKIKNLVYMVSQRHAILKTIDLYDNAIIHIQSSRKWTLFRDLLLAKLIRKKRTNPIFMTIHFANIDLILYKFKLIRNYEIALINSCFDKVLFLGETVKAEFVNNGLNSSIGEVLYTFHGLNILEKPLKQYDPFVILFIGSLDRRKGIIDLLRTIKSIDVPNIRLYICGGNASDDIKEEFDELIKSIGDKADIKGYVTGEEKVDVLLESNVMVLPSYGEGMPIVIFEAMATACGIISTSVGSIPEIVKEANGILFSPGNMSELKEAIMKLYYDRDYLHSMEDANFSLSKDYYIEENIDKLSNIYDMVK